MIYSVVYYYYYYFTFERVHEKGSASLRPSKCYASLRISSVFGAQYLEFTNLFRLKKAPQIWKRSRHKKNSCYRSSLPVGRTSLRSRSSLSQNFFVPRRAPAPFCRPRSQTPLPLRPLGSLKTWLRP